MRIDAAGRAAKAEREAAAARRLIAQFEDTLPWVGSVLTMYEEQVVPAARFVRALDKLMPRIVHILNGGRGVSEQGMDAVELAEQIASGQANMEAYAGEFTELMELGRELGERAVSVAAAR